jgi:hypothetical protein
MMLEVVTCFIANALMWAVTWYFWTHKSVYLILMAAITIGAFFVSVTSFLALIETYRWRKSGRSENYVEK